MKPQYSSPSALFTQAPSRHLLDRRLSRFGRSVALIAALSLPLSQAAWAASATWTGATDAVWADANWGGVSPVPGAGDTATFNATAASVNNNTTIDLGTGVTIGTILFDTASAAAYTIGTGAVNSETLTLSNGGAITMNSTVANNETVNAALVLGTDGSAQTFTLTNNSTTNALTVAGGITGSTGSGIKTLAIAGAGGTTLSGVISNDTTGSVALSKSGGGTLTLSGPNTYTGTTTITGGTLSLTGVNSGAGSYTVTTGTLTINSSGTVSASSIALSSGGSNVSILNLNGGTLLLGSGGMPFTSFNGSAALDFNGGTLKSSAALAISTGGLPINILAGGATIDSSGGAITFGSGLAYAASPGNITIQGGNTVTGSVAAANESGNITVTASGTKLTLNANSGTTSAGSLTINTGATVDMKAFTFTTGGLSGAGTLTDSSTSKVFTITGSAANNFSGSITGAVALTLTGAGALTLSGSNNFTGAFLMGNGTTLQLQANGNNTASGTSYALGAAYGNLKPSAGSETINLQLRSDSSVIFSGLAGIGNLNGATVNFDVNNLAAGSANGATNGGPQGNTLSFFNNTTFLGSANTFNITGGDGYTLAFAAMSDGAAAVQTFNATGASATIASYADTVSNGTLALAGSSTGSAVLGGISGTGLAVTKSGLGTWTLAGGNTYTGATTISAGTLQLGNGGTTGTLSTSSAITDNGTFVINRSNAVTQGTDFSGAAIAGSGALTQAGGGTTTLTAANTFSGLTLVSAGELDLNTTGGQAIAGNLTVSGGTAKLLQASQINSAKNLVVSGGTFNLQGFNQTMGGVQLTGGSIIGTTGVLTSTSNFDMESGLVSASLGGSVGLTKTTGGTVTLTAANSYTGATTISAGDLIFGGSGSLGSVSVADSATLGARVSSPSASVIAPANLTFGVSGASNFAVDFNSLSNPSVAVIALSGGVTLNGTVNVSLANVGNLGNASNNLELMSYASQTGAGAFNLTTTSAGHTTFALNDTATALYLNVTAAINIWTGASSNIWDIGTAGGGSGSHNWSLSDQVYLDGDVVTFDDTASQFNVNIVSTVSPSGVTFSNSSAHTYTLSGAGIAGSGALTLNGANGTVILTNTNTYTGVTTIGSGDTLQLGDGTTDGAITNSSIADNGTLNYDRSTGSSITYGNAIGGTGALTKSGLGTQILTGANTYSGATTISAGTLQLGNGGTAGTLSTSSAITDNGNLAFNRSNAAVQGTDFSGAAITGAGTITQLGSGSLTLNSANNSFSGGVNINAGIVSVANVGISGANSNLGTNGTINIGATTTPGTLLYTGAGETSNKVINLAGTTGGATIDQSGTGLLKFTGNLTATGVGAKTLTLQGSTAGTGEIDGAIVDSSNGATSVTKAGTGTWALTGNSTYTGATTVSAGTLSFQGSSALPGVSAISLGAGTLQILNNGAGSSGTISLGNSVTIPGSLTGTIDVENDGSNAGNTVAFGALNNGTTANANIATINFTGVNGYLQSFSSLALSGLTGGGTTLNPTTTSVTVTGTVTNQESGSVTGHFDTLTLDGTSSGNFIDGAISNSSGYASVGNGDTRITKSNSSTWTLAGNNTYSGPTTVSAGILILSGSNNNGSTSTISVSNGATLQLQANSGNTPSNISYALGTASNKLTLSNGSTLQLRSDSSVNFNGTDSLPSLNGTTITIDVNNIAAGTANGVTNGGIQNQTLTLGSALTSVGTTGQFNITGGNGYTLAFGPLNTANGTGNTETFNPTSASVTIANYNNGAGASNTLVLSGTSTGNAILGAITNTTGSLAVTKSGASTWTLLGANTYSGATTISGGTLQLGDGTSGHDGNITQSGGITDNGTLIYDRFGNLSSGVVISGGGSVTVEGSGSQALIGTNTYTGATTINNGATLQLGDGTSGDDGTISNTSGLTDNGTLIYDRSGNLSSGLVISGNGNVTVSGNGSQTLTGVNTYTGATTISSGATLQLGDGTSGDDGTIAQSSGITDNGTLIYDRFGNLSSGLVITGGGAVTVAGSGSQTLVGTNTYTGATTINSGATLQLGDGTSGDDGTITQSSGITDNGTLIYDRFGNASSGVPIGGTGNVVKIGAGEEVLSAYNNYTGATTVSQGALIVSGELNGTSLVTVSSGATLGGAGTIQGPVNISQGGTIAPGFGLSNGGTEITLNSNLTLSNNAGLSLNIDQTNGADLLFVNGNLTLDPSNTDTLTLNLLGLTITTPTTYIIAAYGGESGQFGSFVVNGNGAVQSINYNYEGDDDIAVTLVAVPEPGTWAMMLAGAGMLVAIQGTQRRRL